MLAGIASTAWALGVAERALHETAAIASSGRTRLGSAPLIDQPAFQEDWGRHRTALLAARRAWRGAVEDAERSEAEDRSAGERHELSALVKAASSDVVDVSRAATTFAWARAGSAATRNPSRRQRCFRDMSVGSGHLVWDPRNHAEYMRATLGLDPV